MKQSKETYESGPLGQESSSATINNVSYSNPTYDKYKDEYPVIANNSYMFPAERNTTEEEIVAMLEDIQMCGFNATIWTCEGKDETWSELMGMYYKVAAKCSLRTILNIGNNVPVVNENPSGGILYSPTLEEIATLLNFYPDNDNLWGYRLADEPNYYEWCFDKPENAIKKRYLPAMYNTYRANSNNRVGFVNLAVAVRADWIGPEIANDNKLNSKEKYIRYLEAFNNKFHPVLLSVDLYPIIIDNTAPSYYRIKYFYYYYMEAIATFSKEYNIPFWMFMLSNQYTMYNYEKDEETTKTEYPYPTVSVLRYQAMTALAYGFQGLVFWTYNPQIGEYDEECEFTDDAQAQFTRTPDGTVRLTCDCECNVIRKPQTIYYNAPFVNGHTTEVWNNCRTVIPEIKLYGKVLLEAKFQEARHVGIPLRNEDKEWDQVTQFDSSSPFECIIDASASGTGFVITHLTKGSDNYMAIVSHDPYNEQDITLSFASGFNWQEITSNNPTPIEDNNSKEETEMNSPGGISIFRQLKPGGMILIRYRTLIQHE